MNTDRISVKQLRALFMVGVLSPAIRLIPNSTILHAKNAAWLSPLFALVPVLLYSVLLTSVSKRHRDGQKIEEALSDAVGKIPCRIFFLLVGVWLALYAGFLLRVDAERLHSTI